MVDKELIQNIDEEIKSTQKLLAEMPAEVRKRTIEVGATPKNVRLRIEQTDGVIIDFERN